MHPTDATIHLDIRGRLTAARLPVLPELLARLMECCQSDGVSAAELAQLVGTDAAMTAKILDQASSPGHDQRGRSADLEQSLKALGTDMVRTLLASESVLQTFGHSPQVSGAGLRSFWKHSLAAAVTARMIAERTGYPHAEEAYLAGLLHDVGRLLLLAAAPDAYMPYFRSADDELLCAVEQRMLSITHAEAGAALIGRWNRDSFLSDSVLYHHQPAGRLKKVHPLIRIASLAHRLCEHAQDDQVLEIAESLGGMTAADLETIRGEAAATVRETASRLGLDLDGADDARSGAPWTTPGVAADSGRERLAGQMRNMILASEARRTFAGQQEEGQLMETAVSMVRVLFNLDDAFVLLLDERSLALTGTTTGTTTGRQGRRRTEFSIPLDGGDAIAETALQRRVTFIGHDENPTGIADEQLLRMLGAECLVGLPLVSADRCHGIMVGGAASWQMSDLRLREGLFLAFGAEVATAYNAIRARRGDAMRELDSVRDQFREASRKVAHEVNNPLSIIKNYLGVLDRKLAKREPVAAEMAILNEEIDRVSRIVAGLAEPERVAREGAMEINAVVADVVRLFRETEYAPASVRILDRIGDKPVTIDSDPDALKQILVNLVKNAIEALPGGGEISIGSNGLVNRDGALYVALWVKDTGPGIPAEVMENLFSPVRTTKGEGHRGLGLNIVHSLVKKIRGVITCRSDSTGTAFEILLPGPVDRAVASRQGAGIESRST